MKKMAMTFIVCGLIATAIGVVLLFADKTEDESTVQQHTTQVAADHDTPVKTDTADTETENQRKGRLFEEYIVGKLSRKYHNIVEWQSDKYYKGRYADNNRNPDLVLQLKIHNMVHPFAIECKWRSSFHNGKVEWASEEKIAIYQQFAKDNDMDVFLALGIGGTPDNPDNLYLIPIHMAKYTTLKEDYLEQFRRDDLSKTLYYDFENHSLK